MHTWNNNVSDRAGGGSVHLDVRGREEARGGRARGEKVGGGDEGGDDEGDGGEEPEGVLDAGEGVVHGGRLLHGGLQLSWHWAGCVVGARMEGGEVVKRRRYVGDGDVELVIINLDTSVVCARAV